MKNFKLLIVTALMVSGISCKQDFLNVQPKDKISSEATWADGALSEAFIFGVYSYLGYGGFEEQALAAYTDEAMFTHAGRNIERFTQGSESAPSAHVASLEILSFGCTFRKSCLQDIPETSSTVTINNLKFFI